MTTDQVPRFPVAHSAISATEIALCGALNEYTAWRPYAGCD